MSLSRCYLQADEYSLIQVLIVWVFSRGGTSLFSLLLQQFSSLFCTWSHLQHTPLMQGVKNLFLLEKQLAVSGCWDLQSVTGVGLRGASHSPSHPRRHNISCWGSSTKADFQRSSRFGGLSFGKPYSAKPYLQQTWMNKGPGASARFPIHSISQGQR